MGGGQETVCTATGPVFIDVTPLHSAVLTHIGSNCCAAPTIGAPFSMAPSESTSIATTASLRATTTTTDSMTCTSASPPDCPIAFIEIAGDGTFEDVTEKAGVGVLDSTACALFADFENRGRQDLLVVCGTGPMLFVNQGDGTFTLKRDAFRFAQPPQGTFTHAAIADYDRDGRLDIYFCTYMYYLGLDQYHYPIPYYDARNGPPNCLFHNEGGGTFVETTEACGNERRQRSLQLCLRMGRCPTTNGLPDLFVANDFGSSQLYRNNGDGTFPWSSREAHVESVGAGMSCCWCRLRQRRPPGYLRPQHVGGRRAEGLGPKSISQKGACRTFANYTSVMRAAMPFITTRATARLKTWVSKPALKWDDGHGGPTSGTSITTALRSLCRQRISLRT